MTTGNAYRHLDTGDQIEGAAFRELVGVPDMVQKGRRPTDEQFASLLMLCLLRMVFFNEVRMVQWAIQRNLLATFSEIQSLSIPKGN